MNDAGREALVAAAMAGVKQIKGAYSNSEGLCALGVLGMKNNSANSNSCIARKYEIEAPSSCPACSKIYLHESHLIAHLNDDHDMDFLTIARKI